MPIRILPSTLVNRIATGEVVLKRSTTVSVISDAASQPYAGVASQQDAEVRVAWEASQMMRTQILRTLAAR